MPLLEESHNHHDGIWLIYYARGRHLRSRLRSSDDGEAAELGRKFKLKDIGDAK